MVHSSRRRNFNNKKKGHEPRENKWRDDRDAPGNQGYREVLKENEKYWEYYKQQNVFPLEQFDEFKAALQRDLPVSFRFQGCHKDREQLIHEMENRFFGKIVEAEDTAVCVPKSLPWYKEAYQTPMSRTAVRSHPILAQLHNFLVTEAELGNLSRQEAVSMIPPLLLAPTSEHYVLDLCAAPGSKTTQLLEMIHENDENPKGMVIANDVDMKRCYMLIHHTLKRFRTAACAVTCEDAARFPQIADSDGGLIQFDRVLADVICSGDGTLRKNPEIWKKWTPQDGLGLHRMQIAIARKGAQQLKVGGRMVYSTCSMNPIEDEAVVAQLLRDSKGSLKLVDTSKMLPELKRENGVNQWKVFDRDMKLYNSLEDISEEKMKKVIVPSLFPPTEEEAKEMNLHYSMRITPHAQDTGGFFVALIEKVDESNFDGSAANGPAWKKKKMFKDEPFTFLKLDDERWHDIRNHYGVDESFKYQNLFSRRLESNDANSRQLFYANDAIKNFVKENMAKVSIQNAGMKMFSRTEGKVENTRFRLSQEGIRYLFKFMNKQKVKIGAEDMLHMLKSEENLVPLEKSTCKEDVRKQQNGTVVVYCDEDEPVCTWVCYHTIAPYISKEERLHLLRMMGVDCAEIELLMKSKRKEKAAQDREAAWARKEEEAKAGGEPSTSSDAAPEAAVAPEVSIPDVFRWNSSHHGVSSGSSLQQGTSQLRTKVAGYEGFGDASGPPKKTMDLKNEFVSGIILIAVTTIILFYFFLGREHIRNPGLNNLDEPAAPLQFFIKLNFPLGPINIDDSDDGYGKSQGEILTFVDTDDCAMTAATQDSQFDLDNRFSVPTQSSQTTDLLQGTDGTSDLPFHDVEDESDSEKSLIEDQTKLPEHACRYCGISDSLCVAKCTVCMKWFCNSNDGTRGGHIVHHMVRSQHKEAYTHKDYPCGDTQLECYRCASKNVFNLGFIPGKKDQVVVIICRTPCANLAFQNDDNWSPEDWKSVIAEKQLLSWIVNVPSEEQVARARKITAQQAIRLEELWREQPEATLDDLNRPGLDREPDHVQLKYMDAHQYAKIFRPLVAIEAEYDRRMKESASQAVGTVRWEHGLRQSVLAFFHLPQFADGVMIHRLNLLFFHSTRPKSDHLFVS